MEISLLNKIKFYFIKLKKKITRKRRLEAWKEEKRKKWLKEGRSSKDIERELSNHRVL